MILKKHKIRWINSEQVKPKESEESIPYEEDELTDSIASAQHSEISDTLANENLSIRGSFVATPEDVAAEKTSNFSSIYIFPNIRSSINTYKTRAAVSIQRFVKQRKVKKIIDYLIKKIQQSKPVKGFQAIKRWASCRNQAAIKIQQAWKNFKLKHHFCLPRQRRHLLAKAVSIGDTLRKIQEIIGQVIKRRAISPPETPMKKHSLLYKKNSSHLRSSSKYIHLLPSLLSETFDTLETFSSSLCEAQSAVQSKVWSLDSVCNDCEHRECNDCKHRKGRSLMLKKTFKVKIRKNKHMKLDELSQALEVDMKNSKKKKEELVSSCIPRLRGESKVFLKCAFEREKKRLSCEYKELSKS